MSRTMYCVRCTAGFPMTYTGIRKAAKEGWGVSIVSFGRDWICPDCRFELLVDGVEFDSCLSLDQNADTQKE